MEDAHDDVTAYFAWEEVLCRRVGQGHPPVVHLWRHPDAFVVGLRDRRLPQAETAMQRIRSGGTSVCVRPSGGAAVPLNPGVLNVSLIIPNPPGRLDIHEDFRLMVDLISRSLAPWSEAARAGEIAGAFCPGDYDVSIEGRKFCGIAQRRQAKALIVSAFIIVEGSGDALADQVRGFYDEASAGGAEGYPDVRSGTMASLQELAGVSSVRAYQASLFRLLQEEAGARLLLQEPSVPIDEVQVMTEKLRLRYDV
ncbi:lipoate--protein ligase family protein [Paenibacillus sp. JX-17]|uniref:Lipoate--protein ligase family protein n=2 Tax=Paenibacillus lacisoli TaxID=3064525 RepID=A0ABT9CG57_9BACL|nr:lipoate--protein ligase family protein [Paenibacillus sp. JX-17]MDO7908256.1 lipoate--protein ligase family protein [Paenibacillus sp. JX-17]